MLRRTRARSAALALAVALLVGAAALPAAAQELEPDPAVRLVVSDIDGMVGPGIDPPPEGQDPATADLGLRLLVENLGADEVGQLQIVVEVHPPIDAPSLLHQALEEQEVEGDLVALERTEVRDGGPLEVGDIAGTEVTVDGDDIGWAGTNGVYPVQVSVLLGADVLDQMVTAVVHLADPPQLPVQTTVVWPLSSPTTRTATGRYPEAMPADIAPDGRLDVLLSTIESHPDAPVLLAIEAETVEELTDRADGFVLVDGSEIAPGDPAAQHAAQLLERLRAVVEASPFDPVVGPYARAHVSALASAPGEVADMAATAIETSHDLVREVLGRAPASDLYLSTTPLTPDALSLTGTGTHLLLPYDQVQASDLAEDLAVGDARQVVPPEETAPQRLATVADPEVTSLLADPPLGAGLALARQRLVAETALLYLTRPGVADRTLLVLPPIHWDPTAGVARVLLEAMLASPWLELTRPAGGGLERTGEADLSTFAAALPSAVTAELIGARDQLAALQAALPGGLPRRTDQTVADLEDALLRSLTPELLADGGRAAIARIRAVREVAESAFGEVRLPDDARVTLTSDTGEVPVTIERTAGGDIRLLVEVDSGAGLVWPDATQQQQITLPEEATRTVAFDTRAVARGTFAVTVEVWDPTHNKLLDSTILSVRSTSISTTALVIIGAVVLILLAVGARRRRSPRLEVVR